jgi:hypothetical protein
MNNDDDDVQPDDLQQLQNALSRPNRFPFYDDLLLRIHAFNPSSHLGSTSSYTRTFLPTPTRFTDLCDDLIRSVNAFDPLSNLSSVSPHSRVLLARPENREVFVDDQNIEGIIKHMYESTQDPSAINTLQNATFVISIYHSSDAVYTHMGELCKYVRNLDIIFGRPNCLDCSAERMSESGSDDVPVPSDDHIDMLINVLADVRNAPIVSLRLGFSPCFWDCLDHRHFGSRRHGRFPVIGAIDGLDAMSLLRDAPELRMLYIHLNHVQHSIH